jgi:pyridoxal phosphate-dependent aminotransferase EpsN
VLEERVLARRRNFVRYLEALNGMPGIEFMPEAPWGRHNRWLTTLTVDPTRFGASREDIRLALEAENIESRPVWKPMHLQPVFAAHPAVGGDVAEALFRTGLCLPSGSNLERSDLDRVCAVIARVHMASRRPVSRSSGSFARISA